MGSNLLRRRRVMAARQNLAGIALRKTILSTVNINIDHDVAWVDFNEDIASMEDVCGAIDNCIIAGTDVVRKNQQAEAAQVEDKSAARSGTRQALQELQKGLAVATGVVFTYLLNNIWREAPTNAGRDMIRGHAEEFVCLGYLIFIQNIIGRIKLLVTSMVGIFVFMVGAIVAYPWCPKSEMVLAMFMLLLVAGTVVILVYAGMHKDPVLSCITDTSPGRLGSDFWIRVGAFAVVPVLSLLAARFPEVNDLLLSSLERGFDALR